MQSFPWHPDGRNRWLIVAGAAVISLLLWFFVGHEAERWIGWAFVVVALLVGLTEGSTMIDPECRKIVRRWKWLGRIPLWQREESLGDFSAVTLRENRRPWPGDPVFLAMARKNGRLLWVGYFRRSAGAAKEAAEQLSRATGLPLADCPETFFSRPVPVG